MFFSLLIFILFSNAITIRRDKSILLCRIVITSLIIISIFYNNLYIKALEEDISLSAAIDAGYIFMALVAIITSVTSLNIISILLYNNLYKKTLNEEFHSDNYSSVQLIKGYYYVNPLIAVSLAITLFSFVGIPPIIGFFAKQMILSAAIDSGYIFMALVAIITSVVGAGYYLNVIKQIFFYKNEYINNPKLENTNIKVHTNTNKLKTITIKPYNIMINSSLSTSISTLTLLLLLFIYTPEEWFSLVSMLTLLLIYLCYHLFLN